LSYLAEFYQDRTKNFLNVPASSAAGQWATKGKILRLFGTHDCIHQLF
jgi:hypothetical protein